MTHYNPLQDLDQNELTQLCNNLGDFTYQRAKLGVQVNRKLITDTTQRVALTKLQMFLQQKSRDYQELDNDLSNNEITAVIDLCNVEKKRRRQLYLDQQTKLLHQILADYNYTGLIVTDITIYNVKITSVDQKQFIFLTPQDDGSFKIFCCTPKRWNQMVYKIKHPGVTLSKKYPDLSWDMCNQINHTGVTLSKEYPDLGWLWIKPFLSWDMCNQINKQLLTAHK